MQSTPVAERALCPLRLRRGVSTQIHRLRAGCCWPHHGYVTLFARAPRIPGRNLQLTDAGSSLNEPRDVGMRRSPGGVRVQHGAARCGQNCGHAGGSPAPYVIDQRGSSLVPQEHATPLFLPRSATPPGRALCWWCWVVVCVVVTVVVSSPLGFKLALLPRHFLCPGGAPRDVTADSMAAGGRRVAWRGVDDLRDVWRGSHR
jgi:hypothetical protein